MAGGVVPSRQQNDTVRVKPRILERVHVLYDFLFLKVDHGHRTVAHPWQVQQGILHEGVMLVGRDRDMMRAFGNWDRFDQLRLLHAAAHVENVQIYGLALKPHCCPKEPARKVSRLIHEDARDMARQIAKSWEGRISRRLRKKIEMLFAHLKRILKLDRLRLRGPNGARDEFLLAATAQNLRKLAKLIPIPDLKPA